MQTRNGGDKTESKSVTWHAAAAFKPIEALEHMLMFVGGNSRPIVGNGERSSITIPRDINDHLATFAAMLDGIIDQVGQRVEQEISIAGDKHALVPGNAQMALSVFRGCVE
jgi:hypothetical protein